MEFKSVNPYNGQEVASYTAISDKELDNKLNLGQQAFTEWRKIPLEQRCQLLSNAAGILRKNVEDYAKMITVEMGKPISESRAEVLKCAWVCDYYAENAAKFLKIEEIKTDATKSYVRHDPIGTVLAIMPWNFPFWQVFRFAAPTLVSGNTAVLKHAPNVFGCANLIESVFKDAGFPENVFLNLVVHHDKTENIIAHDAIRAVTLTGSERAGSAVAAIAGKHIKKTVLELGGNNAFVVLEDADIDAAVKTGLNARMLNCGQSCIAAKRFILDEKIYDEFVSKFIEGVKKLSSGDTLNNDTKIGTLARKDLADQLNDQVNVSVSQGADLLYGGKQDNCFHEPTILGNVTLGMAAFDEETFGPLAAMIKAKNTEHAFELAEQSKFGLGISVFTSNIKQADLWAEKVSDAAFFVNELVKSDPRLPFGGTKKSGYGRELSKDGMMEFVNRKTVYINDLT